MTIEPFRPQDFAQLDLQPAQAYARAVMTPEYLAELATVGPAYTASIEGKVLFCGGLADHPRYPMLWSYVGRDAGRHFLRLHRGVERFLQVFDRPLIAATCLTGFEAGARWLSRLGFEYVKGLGAFGPARLPHDLYARVRP